MSKKLGARAVAARLLAPVILAEHALNLDAKGVTSDNRALVQTLTMGVLRNYFYLRALADQLLAKPLKKKDTDIVALILLGLYQLDALRTPDHAAIAETVEAAKQLGKQWAAKLVNGVLRHFQRRQDELKQHILADDAAQYNHPLWLLERLRRDYPDQWPQIVTANNQQPPICLRANTLKLQREHLVTQFSGVEVEMLEHANDGLRLLSPVVVTDLPGFTEGCFSVQDEAAQLAAPLLHGGAPTKILDACSAPGGKASHLAERYPDAELTCIELEQARLAKVKENFARLQLTADFVCADASALDTWWDGRLFDAILLDAPCSGSGVVRRHPDIKLLRRESDVAKLARLQQDLLTCLWPTLAPGGVLLYATCSILPDENEAVVRRFLDAVADAEHDPIRASWGQARSLGRQLLPQQGGHDGFYYCRLIKT